MRKRILSVILAIVMLACMIPMGTMTAVAAADDFSAGDYVQKGLIAQFDGIENAGKSTHNAKASAWTDLTGNGHNAVIKNGTSYSDYWDSNSFKATGDIYAQIDGMNLPSDRAITIEVVCQNATGSTSYPTLMVTSDNVYSLYKDGSSSTATLYLKHNDNSTSYRPSISSYNGSSVIATINGKNATLGYAGTLNTSSKDSPNAARVATLTIFTSVILLRNGTVRLERGFTSIT